MRPPLIGSPWSAVSPSHATRPLSPITGSPKAFASLDTVSARTAPSPVTCSPVVATTRKA